MADVITSVQPNAATPAQIQYQKGLDALSANHLAEAEASFQRSLDLDPKLVRALLGLADVSMRKGDTSRAALYLQQAAVLSPKDAEVLTVRGHFLFFQKNYPEAEKMLKTAITADPKLERPRYELGDVYLLGLKKPKDAIDAYRAALSINPSDFRVHYTLANALAQVGQLDDAQKHIEEASRLDPKNLGMLIFLGDFYRRRGKLDQAQQAYERALAADPRFIPAQMAEADLFVAKRDLDHALERYSAVVHAAPNSTDALLKIGVIHELKGRWNEAEQAYRQALSVDPKLGLAANNLAWVLNEHQHKPAEALKWSTKAVELAPQDFNAQDTLGWVLRANGDAGRALMTLKKANALAPQNPQILYHLGVLYQESKQQQAAVQSFSKALELSKHFDAASDAQLRLDALRKEQSRSGAR